MKKVFFNFAAPLVLACLCGLTACAPIADPAKADNGVYDTGKLYSSEELRLSENVKELKDFDGGLLVKTEFDIAHDAKMTLEVLFKDDKFEDVKMIIQGTDRVKYEDALELEFDTTPAATQENPEPQPAFAVKSNNPEAVVGEKVRLPRADRTGANNKAENPFDFDTKPADGVFSDHQAVGSAAFGCLQYSVAAYRFVLAAKNVFGSYANYTQTAEKPVVATWEFGGTLATASANSAAVRIERVLEFPLSHVIFAASEAIGQHGQTVVAMVRIDKKTHRVLNADYAFYHVSEYRGDADVKKYTDSLASARTAVIGADAAAKIYSGKAETADGAAYQLGGVASATLTNSVLVNAFNAAFAYYNANLKA